MEVTGETIEKRSSCPHKNVVDRASVEHNIRFGPALFYSVCYMNDEWYLSGDKTDEVERVLCAFKRAVKFAQARSPGRPADFPSHSILAIQALQNLDFGEELYYDSGRSYSFNQ